MMKHIILSADGECGLYLVPDEVVDNLPKYIGNFRDWMVYAPEAFFVKNIGYINSREEVPEAYKGCIYYNF